MKKVFLFLSLIATGILSAQEVKPVINLASGTQFEAEIKTDLTMNMDVMGQSMETKTKTKQKSDVVINEKTATGYKMTNTIRKMSIDVSTMGQEMSYDSEKEGDESSPIAEGAKERLNKPESIETDLNGKITKVGNGDNAGSEDPMESMVTGMAVGQQYPLFIPGNGKTMKVGDTWTDSTGTLETIKLVNNYKVTGISGDVVSISLTGTMRKSGKMDMQGQEMEIELTGDTSAENEYNKNTGLCIKSKGKVAGEGTMSIQGQSIPLTMITLTEMEVEKK